MGVAGKWINELGSTMELEVAKDGTIKGTYLSSKAGHDKKTEPLRGLCRSGSQTTYVGWVVCYSNTNDPTKDPSVCRFSGHYFESKGKEIIETTWINTHVSEQTKMGQHSGWQEHF